jgi:hypothetical protein
MDPYVQLPFGCENMLVERKEKEQDNEKIRGERERNRGGIMKEELE